MNKSSFLYYIVYIGLFLSPHLFADENNKNEQKLTIYQVMQRVINRYPSLQISQLKIEQAAQQKQQIESRLGWMLKSSSGITHDLTALGTPSDRFDITSSFSRQLKSGSSLSLNGGYRYEDSSLSFNSSLPNPAHTTKFDVSYRIPLLQGEGNPLYKEGLISADSALDLAKANLLLTRIFLAEKVKGLFYSIAVIDAKLDNAKQAVQRTRKLMAYINKNIALGLAEKKDKLQIQAQLYSKLAELSGIQLQKQQQRTSLNRLMLEDWQKTLQVKLVKVDENTRYIVKDLIKATELSHPRVKISLAKLSIAESQINSSLDTKKDSFDFIMSMGSRTSDGQSAKGTVSELDWAGTVRFEYQYLFDNKGVSSKHKQALIEKTIVQQNLRIIKNDIHYTVSGLVSEISAAKFTVKASNKKLQSEFLKLQEVEQRFRSGRANTAQLIQFQNEYSSAQLAHNNQKIDLNNRIIALQIFTGEFWNNLTSSSKKLGGQK